MLLAPLSAEPFNSHAQDDQAAFWGTENVCKPIAGEGADLLVSGRKLSFLQGIHKLQLFVLQLPAFDISHGRVWRNGPGLIFDVRTKSVD